jgi:glycosyltransferase involved in cell wall biosynthesis
VKVWYLPLEPYRERYTEQLLDWTVRAFKRNGLDHEVILGRPLAGAERIRVGPVLDAQGRCHWALTQMAQLVARMDEISEPDVIFFEDLFTPGYEAIPYVFSQLTDRVAPTIATRNYAQSVDPDDFTFAMRSWMRHYEHMVDKTCGWVFVASTCHKQMWEAAGLGGSQRVVVTGLPFDVEAVRAQGPLDVRPWDERPLRVVYSSRLDREKQPDLFLDVVEHYATWSGGTIEFVLCTGSDAPRSNMPGIVERIAEFQQHGWLTVRAGLTKPQYYAELAQARVQLNTARQDFISFTAIEASTFGVPTLAPGFRSFPEALENRDSQLYTPWVASDLRRKLEALLYTGEPRCGRLAEKQGASLDRMCGVFKGFETSGGGRFW